MMDALSLLPEHRHARFDSRHRLVLAASQRAKHLLQGGKPLGMSKFTKDTTIALDEVLQGLIEFLAGKEARHGCSQVRATQAYSLQYVEETEREQPCRTRGSPVGVDVS